MVLFSKTCENKVAQCFTLKLKVERQWFRKFVGDEPKTFLVHLIWDLDCTWFFSCNFFQNATKIASGGLIYLCSKKLKYKIKCNLSPKSNGQGRFLVHPQQIYEITVFQLFTLKWNNEQLCFHMFLRIGPYFKSLPWDLATFNNQIILNLV
jgi:hypothetical protein